MSLACVLNLYGKYEERDGGVGMTVSYGGRDFWLPYEQVSYFPNWTFRDVDQDKSSPDPDSGIVGEVVYTNTIVRGERLAEEICNKRMPHSLADMGVIPIVGKTTGKTIVVPAGVSDDGTELTTEVAEREPTPSEKRLAAANAKAYKEKVIADYFQSKRERMTGGRGKIYPDPTTRAYMEELQIEDLDDVTAHAKHAGYSPDFLKALLKEVGQENAAAIAQNLAGAVDSVRKAGKAQLSNNLSGKRHVSLGLAERKAAYDAEQAAKEAGTPVEAEETEEE